jgi:pimeloyl-ACP methyl ester carboxylesterase
VLTAFLDGTLFGEKSGSGDPEVIFLHGWGRTHADFSEDAAVLLADGVTSLALDLPGFGATPAPASSEGTRSYVRNVIAVLEELGVRPRWLVGHSFGGRIAVQVAAERPDLVGGLILTGVPLLHRQDRRRPSLRYRVVRYFVKRGWLSSERLERARKKYGSADYQRLSGVMREVFVSTVNESYESSLRELRCPVWLVWGREDREVPVEILTLARPLMTAPCEVEIVDSVGHLLPRERPGLLARAYLKAVA